MSTKSLYGLGFMIIVIAALFRIILLRMINLKTYKFLLWILVFINSGLAALYIYLCIVDSRVLSKLPDVALVVVLLMSVLWDLGRLQNLNNSTKGGG